MRVSHDGWATYTCRIEQKIGFRGRPLYRYVILRKFVKTEPYKRGFWIGDRYKVIERAQEQMDRLDKSEPRGSEYL